jgi:hypothetical protein
MAWPRTGLPMRKHLTFFGLVVTTKWHSCGVTPSGFACERTAWAFYYDVTPSGFVYEKAPSIF